jgi:hypothetical protein
MFKIIDINKVPNQVPETIETIVGHDHVPTQNDVKIWLRDQYGADVDVINEQIIEFSTTHRQVLLNVVGVILLLLILFSVYKLYRIFVEIIEKKRIASIVRKKAE